MVDLMERDTLMEGGERFLPTSILASAFLKKNDRGRLPSRF